MSFNPNFVAWQLGRYFRGPILLAIRLYIGLRLASIGTDKFTNIAGFAGWLTQMGVPAPQFMAYSVASIEAGGGYMFAAGLFPYFTSLAISVVMTCAMILGHPDAWKAAFSNPKLFLEQPPIPFLIASLFVLTCGPGFLSLDFIFGKLTTSGEQEELARAKKRS